MAGKKSIGDLHSNVTANAQQFVNEFQRADNVARQRTAAIDKELDKLGKSIKTKFSGADVGKSILQGLGVGSGFAAVDLVVGKFVDLWREADDKAKEAQVSIEKLNATFSELHRLTRESAIEKLLPAEQITARKEQLAAVRKQLDDLAIKAAKYAADMGKLHDADPGFISGTAFDPFKGEYGYGKIAKTLGDEITTAQDKIMAEMVEKYTLLNQLTGKIKGAKEDMAKGDKEATTAEEKKIAAMNRVLDAKYKKEQDGLDLQAEALTENLKAAQSLDELADKYRDLADPLAKYKKQLEEIALIQSRAKPEDRLNAEEAAAAVERIQDAMFEARFGKPSEKPGDFDADAAVDKLQKVGAGAKAMEQELNMMWNSVSDRAGQAFADMVLTGEAAFSDLVNIVARSVVEMAARLAVINPILNYLFNLSGPNVLSAFYGRGAAARADGGPVDFGQSYLVGEQGPEIFTPQRSGTIIPNHALAGGRGGNTYIIDARGTDESVVMRLQSALVALAGPGVVERRALTAVGDARRRGTY